ncbi:MAG: hypothetical protein QOD02_662 [Mycobacterium sp.]|jgi:hypothetical protein|nr:hypothetical protein [Mycobacterium sp.]
MLSKAYQGCLIRTNLSYDLLKICLPYRAKRFSGELDVPWK